MPAGVSRQKLRQIRKEKNLTQTELAEKYLNLFTEKSGIEKRGIQRWVPIVAAVQLKKGGAENREFLEKWIDVVDYE